MDDFSGWADVESGHMKTTLFTLLCSSLALAQDARLSGRALTLQDSPANPVAVRASSFSAKSIEARDRAARAFAFAPAASGSQPANDQPGCTIDPASPAIGTDISSDPQSIEIGGVSFKIARIKSPFKMISS